ncbi:YgaP family membrane protein [Bacillus haikouensis]|jgi:hypothetical protein|uniref:YgaP family membrane protein n=1 Tax=Bacillus haikouensis TaxID=1510468 RepID=UPI0028AF326A|nr:DUF2892 domain-containing protein [Bacillus haikouensis]
MKVSSNIGIINALIRITLGLTILSWTTAKLVKRPWRDSYLVMAMIGAMKVAEGILRYCPVTDLLDKSGDNDDKKSTRGLGGLKGMDMFNVKDMLKSSKKKNESTGSSSHDTENNTTGTTSAKKNTDFNPEDLSNKEVQEALNGDLGKSSSKTSSFNNQGFTQI